MDTYSDLIIILATLGTICIFIWLMAKLVRFTKTKKINTELWCTIFEGFTQGAVRLDHLKNPETVIEKKIRRDGKDKETFDEEWLAKEALKKQQAKREQ